MNLSQHCISFWVIQGPKFEILTYLCFWNASTKWSKPSICLVSTIFFGNVVRVSQNLGICFALVFSESIYPLNHTLTCSFSFSFNTYWVLIISKLYFKLRKVWRWISYRFFSYSPFNLRSSSKWEEDTAEWQVGLLMLVTTFAALLVKEFLQNRGWTDYGWNNAWGQPLFLYSHHYQDHDHDNTSQSALLGQV